MDWMNILRTLYPEGVGVEHEPKTDAYWRAETALQGIIDDGLLIGIGTDHFKDSLRTLLVVWVEPLNLGEAGEYTVFKVFSDEFGPYRAVLFAYYDGIAGRPGFYTIQEAIFYMKAQFPDYIEVQQ